MTAFTLRNGDVSVPMPKGGSIAITIRNGSSRPILAIHGISSNSRLWLWLMELDPRLTLVMPDLRGRGRSMLSGGSPSQGSTIKQHAQDMVCLLDHLGIDAVDVMGMSMGGFVAVALAGAYPHRVKSLTLLDGGPPMRPPPGLCGPSTSGDASQKAFDDRFQRLGRTWSVPEYKALFTSATAPLVDPDNPLLESYLRYDLGLDGSSISQAGTVHLARQWLEADALDLFSEASLARWNNDNVKAIPTRLSRAQWSVGRDTPPAYGLQEMDRIAGRVLREELVREQDHAGTIMTVQGAAVAGSLLCEALGLEMSVATNA